jgi:hypothetical protein
MGHPQQCRDRRRAAGSVIAGASSWTAASSGTRPYLRRILRDYETHHDQHRPYRSPHAAAPMKPLPAPVDLDQYRVRKCARVGGLICQYRLVA